MSPRIPRYLIAVVLDVRPTVVAVTFTLGEPIPLEHPAEYYTYGFALHQADGTPAAHLGVRFSPTGTKAYILTLENGILTQFGTSDIEVRTTSVLVEYPMISLTGYMTGGATGRVTIDGETAIVDIPVQLLP